MADFQNNQNSPVVPPESPQGNVPQQPLTICGIVGVVVAVIALLTSPMPIINNGSFFLGLIAAVVSTVGLVGTVRGKKRGKAVAIVGLALAVISCAVVLGTQSMYSAAIDKAFDNTPKTTGNVATQNAAAANTSTNAAAQASFKYEVTIGDCRLAQDYEGNPAAVVTYTWTNNSDKDVSFLVAVSAKAFQNNVQLDTAIGSAWDSMNIMKEVKSGGTQTVELAYKLTDKSDMLVECSELISFKDTVFASKSFTIE